MPGAVPKTVVCLLVAAAALGACSGAHDAPPGDIQRQINALYARSAARAVADDPADLTDAARRLVARARLGLHQIPTPPGGLDRAVSLPKTIRVWRRSKGSSASCSGQVDVLELEEYVKGVLPHEWIVSWEVESLRAGAVAIRSYAASWVQRGGKYTCADLDDTTYSQVYKDDRKPKASAAVDDTRGEVVVKDGALVFAEYSAENGDPTKLGVSDAPCAGKKLFGHGRGMCQWGSQRWAKQGKAYEWIAEHYYPGATLYSTLTTTPDGSATTTDAGADATDAAASNTDSGAVSDASSGGNDALFSGPAPDGSTQRAFGNELRGGCTVGASSGHGAAHDAAPPLLLPLLLLSALTLSRVRRRAASRRAALARRSRAADRSGD